MGYCRTPEHRKRQAELIRKWKPREKSTGPKSRLGKSVATRNAWKGGVRPMIRQLSKALREHASAINKVATDTRSE